MSPSIAIILMIMVKIMISWLYIQQLWLKITMIKNMTTQLLYSY
jgi:uncharacterized membrane protein YbaN (DUF454 family)